MPAATLEGGRMEKGQQSKPRRRNGFKLRLPDRVRDQVQRIADARGMSVNSWLCNLIARAIEEANPPPAPKS